MTDSEFDPRTSIYTPLESSNYALAAIEKMRTQKTRAAKLDIEVIRDYFAPVMPGQVAAVIGQTSNGKSMFLHMWERMLAEQLMQDHRDDEAVVHVSVEECVEEQAYLDLAHLSGEDSGKLARGEVQDWNGLKAAAVKVGTIPIYRIGDSLARAEDMPNLSLSNMVRSIRSLVNGEVCDPVKPAALFFDYLQAFPFDAEHRSVSGDQRRLQVREDMYRLRLAAAYFNCPVIVAVQAKQHLDNAMGDVKLPGIYDGEESSSIAQRCDRIITLWMPAKTSKIGDFINDMNPGFKVEENIMFVKVAKQRGGLPSGMAYKCRIDFIHNTIKLDQN